MNLDFHLRIAGLLQIMLAFLHLFFPRRFRWKEELSRLSLLNRQIFVVHTIFICIVLAMMGSLSLLAPHALLERSVLARLIAAGFASFWAVRLLFQWVVYDSTLWRGQPFNTVIHILFTALWLYLTVVYAQLFRAQL